MTFDARQQRGLVMVRSSGVREITAIGEARWLVLSQSRTKTAYVVDTDEGTCTCPDQQEHRGMCKHLWAVAYASGEITPLRAAEELRKKRLAQAESWRTYRREPEAFVTRNAEPTTPSGRGGVS